ncbi:MAG: glycosyltransferase family 2 protein, partial [Desulfomonile tiedjei]|nr:glycosyltransferase family 2 protein [Desulfomonile tiedjei]
LGKGYAVREGLTHCTGDIVMIQDGDLEYDLWDYEALIRPIAQSRCSFTLGARHKGKALKMRKFIDKPFMASVINFGHWALTFIFNRLYGQSLKDPFTMFKVFRRDCIRNVSFECDHFDFDIELVIRLIRRGFTPLEIPVNYVSRSFSEGKKVSFAQDPVRILAAMIKLRFAK